MQLFDLDGTLIDSNGIWLEIDLAFLAGLGIPYDASYTEYVAHTTYQQAAAYTRERFGLAMTEDEIMAQWAGMAHRAYAETIPLKPGVLEYLTRTYERGEGMAIVTSCIPELCEAALTRLGIRRLFRHVTTGREVTRDKKHPDIYLLAAEKEGAEPRDCTVFEDAPSAAGGAKAAGMRVVGVYDKCFAPREAELRQVCDRYIMSFEELLEEGL